MVKNTKKDNRTPSVVPEVVITNQPDEGNVRDANTLSREPSRDRSSRSVSISRLKAGDPLRKEMMFVREKSPFEIGENRDIQLASSKAIIDKALIMDVSGGITKVDEYVSLFFSPGCVIDAAVCEDISTQQTIEVVVVEEEEEDERPELVITPLNSMEETIIHQETGEIDESKIDLSSVTEESLPLETTEISSEPDIATFASNIDGEVTELSNTDEVNKQEETQELTEIAIEDNIKQESDKTEEEEDEIEEDEEEEEEEEEEETESSSDESYEELVDPSLWRVYDPNSEDPTAWFYKPPEEVTAEPTEKERDEEFRRARLSRRIPIFLTNLTDRAGPLGSDIKLQCTLEGLEMTCKWLKNDQLVERTSRLQTTAIDGLYTLVLKDVEKYDEGVYTIVAKNRGGEVSSSAKVRIYEDPRDRIEIPTIVKIRDYYHHALNDLIIECQIMSKPSWSVPEVTWLKGEDPVTLDNRVRATYEGNEIFQLNIYNPTPDDSGIYTCVAKNSAGEQEITHEVDFTTKVHYIHLPGMHHADKKILTEEELLEKREQDKKQAQERAALRSSSRPEPPSEPYKEESFVIRDSKNKLTWAGQLHNITAQKDQIVKMICSVNGDQAIIKWQKNGKAIEYDDRVKLLNSGVIGQIMINGVRPRDAGEYVCTAKNNYNEIKTSCVLKVIQLATLDTSPPTFTKAIKEFYDLRANDLVLETQVHGVPNPNIQWYKDDEKIIYNDKLMLNREPNGRYQLRIHKPHIEDCGIYECRANNSDGQSKVKHEVKFSSNETFVHAHRIEHAERFKRLLEEEIEFSSAQNITQEAPQPEVKSREINAESAESPSNDTEVEKGEEEVANINKDSTVTETEQPVEKEPTLPKPKPTIKPRTMPRRRFDEGPTEPFIIRDSKKKLLWESKLKNFTAQEGGSIKLVCIVAGPQPQYKWMKNGKPLVWSKDVINATKAEFGCVKINHASLSDAGEYTAIAKNADSEIECTCKVTVFSSAEGVQTKPTFTRITDYYDIRVNDLILEVQVRGTPAPTLLWERDGRELHNGMDRIMIAREKDGVYKLSIHDPVKLDGGHWVITAKNTAGEEKVKHHVIFKGKEHYQHVSGIYHADPRIAIDESSEYHIPGRSRSVSRAASVLSIKSQPREASIPITEDALNAALTEHSVQMEASDENTAPLEEKSTKKSQKKSEWRKKLSTLYDTQHLPIPEEPKKPKALESKQKLYFDAQLKNMTVAEGSTVKLICSCVGPAPTIKWYKNNTPISYSKILKNETKLGVGAINFSTTTVNDSGTYKCVANNNFGEVETSCLLTVFPVQGEQHEAPKFVKNVREFYDIQVNDLILEVQVRGNPHPSIKWYRDGIELEDTEGDKFFLLREPNGIHKLTIHDPQIKDQGRYMCEAENVAGKDTIRHEVRKLNKDDYCHVYGIAHHDPSVMKHGIYEEQQEVVEREHREVVFLEDGTYYMRGQTPEHLWEYETDTSAASEYEPYDGPPTEEEIEEDDKDEEESEAEENKNTKIEENVVTESNDDKDIVKAETEQEDTIENSEDVENIEEEKPKPPPVIKRGPKIKKMRKKVSKSAKIPQEVESAQPSQQLPKLEEIKPQPKTQSTETDIREAELSKDEQSSQEPQTTDVNKTVIKSEEVLRKERYLRLFPELVPVPQKPEESKNALKFITELRDIAVMAGKPAKLFCTILGPKPDIKWFKNGEPMEFTKTIKNQSHEGTGIVSFAQISESDEGVYTAVIKNKENHVITTQAKISIIRKPELPKGMGPRFITNIDQHYDFRVDDLILETHIKGDGLLRVQWFLDGIEIENNDKYIQIREPMGVYKLCIHNPQPRDSGRYTIQVSNDFGKAEQKYNLRFEGKTAKPSYGIFHADPRRQYADDEEEKQPRQYREVVFLEDGSYYVRGKTPEEFWEWETDTSAESEYEEYISEGNSETSEEEKEEGNDEDDEKNSKEDDITIEPAKQTEPDIEIAETEKEPEEEEHDEDEDQPIEEPPKVIKRGPKIKKMRKKVTKPVTTIEATPISLPAQETIKPTGAEVTPKTRISQRILSGQPSEPLPAPKPKRKPVEVEFISHLRNQTILKGKTLSLNCCCSDNQKLEVSWFKDGQKFEMNKRCVSDVHFGFITLEIYRTTIEDSGVYECQVKTANGEAKDSCKINVFELPDKEVVELVAPMFIHPLSESYHPTTNDLHLETRVRGNPVPTLTWSCDGIVIPHSTDKFEIFNQHYYELGTKITNATLIINNPQLKDSGKYTLRAKNEIGKVEVTRQVKIGLRSEHHKKKRMDDIVIQNEAPRVIPKPPTPEPEPEPEPEPVVEEENVQEAEETHEEEEEDEEC